MMRVLLADDSVPLDTNHVERALRCIQVGKRNWLFCWIELGAEQVGIIQSLISTRRLHNINPYDYLKHVFKELPNAHTVADIEQLLPWNDKLTFGK